MKIVKEGSVRVDLVGGTLDLEPIALILKNVITINMATGLKAKVELENTADKKLHIYSSDYQKEYIYGAEELTDSVKCVSPLYADVHDITPLPLVVKT